MGGEQGNAAKAEETWRPCPHGRGLYDVSSLGRVRSWNNNRWGRRAEPRILIQHARRDGYKVVNLGRGVVKGVGPLVCEAFHGPCPEGMECAHWDGMPANNAASNVRWATPAGNAEDRQRHGTAAAGERVGSAKLTAAAVADIRARVAAGARNIDLANEYNVAPSTISGIKLGAKWREAAQEVS